jgi:outer membrane protein assembly factor BamB
MNGDGARIRWQPAAVIVLAAMALIAWVWLSDGDRTRQERIFVIVPIAIVSLFLLAAWLAFYSNLRRGTRIRIGVVLFALLGLAAATTRVRGVTGDLLPIFEWRWSVRTPAAPELPPPAEPAAAPKEIESPAPSTGIPSDSPAASAPANLPVNDGRPALLTGADYPQYLGPNRDGTIHGVTLTRDWSSVPPKVMWRRRVGAGWSGFAIANGLAVTQEQRGSKESIVAYSLADGAPRWSHGDEAHFESTVAGEGPRATPTISRGRVFALGSTGILNALDLHTGRRLWQRDVARDNDSAQPDWGRSSSPLAVDDLVVVSVGGMADRSLVAYDRETGAPVWHAGDDLASYSSPQLTTLGGVRQIVIMNESTIFAHDPSTGRVLWRHDWRREQPSVAQPLLLPGNRLLFSAGYGIGSRLLQIDGDAAGQHATLVWESTRLKAKFTNLVVHDGFVYGLDDGVLACVDPANGERKWKGGRYGHGQVLLVEDLLLVQTEEGELVLIEPRPDALRELGRFAVFAEKTWNPPALAGRYLLVRNDMEAVLLELPGR